MSDKPDSKMLSDDQVDRLLGAFYQQEIPAALDQLPSTWAQLASAEKAAPADIRKQEQARPTVTVGTTTRKQDSSGSRIVAVLASMAACAALVVLTNLGGGTQDYGDTLPVSGGEPGSAAIVDPESSTTMEEVEGFEFAPEKEKEPAESPDSADE
ncbi:MAG: hypothetical protein NXI04_12020 [Planctomycetaceae bacterium]|nr:hypothetical protein [Planctomycetaceae bacterium]